MARAVVGEFVIDRLSGNVPAHKETSKQSTQRHHEVGRQLVAEVHERRAQHLDAGECSYRPGAEDADDRSYHRGNPCSLHAGQVKLLGEECRTYLVHGDGAGQCGKDQQGIEHDADRVGYCGEVAKGLLEHVGQGDEDERRSAVGTHTHREGRGEYHQAGQDGYHGVEQRYLSGGAQQTDVVTVVAGIGTQTRRT